MTRARRVPTPWLPGHLVLAQPASGSGLGVAPLFFEPQADSFPRDTEDALQSAQTAALFIGTEDLLPFGFGIASWLGVITTTPVALVTPVPLFAVGRAPIAH